LMSRICSVTLIGELRSYIVPNAGYKKIQLVVKFDQLKITGGFTHEANSN